MRAWKFALLLIVIALLAISVPNFVVAQDTAPEENALALALLGPYDVGARELVFIDTGRDNRELPTRIWYPGLLSDEQQAQCDTARQALKNENFGCALPDVEPDTRNAPNPLILFSPPFGSRHDGSKYAAHLASYGFVVAAMDHDCYMAPTCLTDRPLDMLYVLDQLALDETNLTSLIDTSNVGVTGASDGGYTTLALNGARIDPENFLNWYEDGPTILSSDLWAQPWDEIEGYRAQLSPPLETGELWPAFTDERIRAVAPVVPCYGPLFGERGLAAAQVPTFLMAGTADRACSYERDAIQVYKDLGSEERFLLSFIGQGHNFFSGSGPSFDDQIHHFLTAFFGYYLQGQEEYAEYLTADFVEQFEDLAWGVYEAE